MKLPQPFLLSAVMLLGITASAHAAPVAPSAFTISPFASAPSHSVFGPDDITSVDGNVYVAWQNGIGPKGQAGPHHNLFSTVVKYSHTGRAVAHWSLQGHVDGIAGDGHRLIATANEDGNALVYVVKPTVAKKKQITQYIPYPAPDAKGSGALLTGGGLDSITVVGGKILVSASAPTRSGRTATFVVTLGARKVKPAGAGKKVRTNVALLAKTFSDRGTATDAVSGNKVTLHLTDPDSNALVPISSGDAYAGDYVLNDQAGDELIFSGHGLMRLGLSWGPTGVKAGVDDVRWAPSDHTTLYAVDSGANTIYKVTGPFAAGDALASMDSIGSASAGSTIASLNDGSGELDPFITGLKAVKGLLFMP
ncbi:MAG TPA: hypothetical protein VFN55_06925 [Solirubrobacteraceae bacterium]|nr:hypothetical protein [Solirubrobacteraceae bacterium]